MGYALLACVGYAVGANITRNYLYNVSPVAITAGSYLSPVLIKGCSPVAFYEFPYGKSISLNCCRDVCH